MFKRQMDYIKLDNTVITESETHQIKQRNPIQGLIHISRLASGRECPWKKFK